MAAWPFAVVVEEEVEVVSSSLVEASSFGDSGTYVEVVDPDLVALRVLSLKVQGLELELERDLEFELDLELGQALVREPYLD